MRKLSEHDAHELGAFRRWIAIVAWRENELGESRFKALGEAGLEVYGDKGCEGTKHHKEAR